MGIRELQNQFAQAIEQAKKHVHLDKEELFNLLAKQFEHSSKLPAMLKFIESNKQNWDKKTYDLAKWYYEDLADTYGYYHKYEMSSVYNSADIKKLCLQKESLAKKKHKTTDTKEIKDIEDQISAIKQQILKAKSDIKQEVD